MAPTLAVSSALALLVVPLIFDMGCEDPTGAPKLFCWLLAAGLACGQARWPPRAPWWALAAWWLWALVSAVWNGPQTAWLPLVVVGAGLVWILARQQALPWLALGWGATVTYSWIQRLHLDPVDWSNPELSRARTIAGLGNPNYLAMYLAALFPLMWHYLYQRGPRYYWLSGPCLCALFLTGTRGSSLALCAVLVLATLYSRLKDRRFWLITWAMFVGAGIVSAQISRNSQWSFSASLQRTTLGRGDLSINARVMLWSSALRQGLEHPVLGVGPGHFGDGYLLNRELEPEQLRHLTRKPEDPHNEPLRIFSETGLMGLALWSAWLLLALRWRFQQLGGPFLSKPAIDPACGAELASLLVLLANGMTNCYPLAIWPLLLLWTIPPAAQAPPRRWGIVPALLGLTVGLAGWATQRAFWWDDEDQITPGRINDPARLKRLLLTESVCPPWYQDTLATRLSRAWQHRAQVTKHPVDWHQAVVWADHRVRLNPKNAYAWHFLYAVESARGDYIRALPAAQEAVKRDPMNPGFHFFLGLTHYQLRDRESALTSLNRSLEIYSNKPQVYQFRSQIRIELGRTWEGYWDWVRSQQIEQGE